MSNKNLVLVSKKDFRAALDRGEECYMKKPKSWKCMRYKWKSKSEKWFMDLSEDVRRGKVLGVEKIGLLIATQLDNHFRYFQGEGYEFYLDTND